MIVRRILPMSMIPATGSCRKTPEIAGTWKQYSDRKLSRFFPLDPFQLPVLSDRSWPEIIGKISARNTASTELPGTGSFLAALIDLGSSNIHSIIFIKMFCEYRQRTSRYNQKMIWFKPDLTRVLQVLYLASISKSYEKFFSYKLKPKIEYIPTMNDEKLIYFKVDSRNEGITYITIISFIFRY